MAGSDHLPLVFRDTALEDSSALAAFAQMTLASSWNEAFVAWKYFRNPAGPIYGRCARLDEQPVAFYGNTPVRLKLGNQILTAAQAVDAMVVPEMRRRGLFVTLARQTYQQMDEAGVALTYAFPSPESQAGFLGRLAWTSVGAIPRYVRLLNVKSVVRASGRTAPARWLYVFLLWAISLAVARREPVVGDATVSVSDVAVFDERFDALWQDAAREFPVAIVRDTVYLNWRYVQNPLSQHLILAAERDKQLVGYAVLSKRDVQKSGVVALVELLVAPGEKAAGLALLAESMTRAQALGGSQLQCWMLSHHTFHRHLLEQSGFVFWPVRYAPGILRYTIPFIIRPRPGMKLSPDPTSLENWYLSMGDHDYW